MPVEKSIVHISVQSVGINYKKVTSTPTPRQTSGSGWIADIFELSDFEDKDNPNYLQHIKKLGIPINQKGQGIVIVTNAHVIHNQVSLQVRLSSSSKKYSAKIIGIAHDRDLAILTVEDKDFVDYVEPYTTDKNLPKKETPISSYGFAQNGTDLAFSSGVFARTTNSIYGFSSMNFLNLEVTAAINHGCSGGIICNPATNKVIGVIHQTNHGGNQQSYAIPTLYLKNVARELLLHGKIFGAPALFMSIESMQDPSKREFYGLSPKGEDGVLIKKITSEYQQHLLAGDVILKIDGHTVKSDGTVNLDGLNVALKTILEMRLIFDIVPLKILRNKQEMDLEVSLEHVFSNMLQVPICPSEQLPPYIFRHGVLFCTLHAKLSQQCQEATGNTIPPNLYHHISKQNAKNEKRHSVIFIQLMGGQDLAGYGSAFENKIITHINDKKITDIWSVKHILDDPALLAEKFLRIRTEDSHVDNLIVPIIDNQKEEAYQKLYRVHSPQALVSHFDQWKKAIHAASFIQKTQQFIKEKHAIPSDEAEVDFANKRKKLDLSS